MVTVDQAGTGSSGTFTVTVDATSVTTDTATGSVPGNSSLTASGNGSIQAASHLVMSGTYANGAFTVTSETYGETGSYTAVQYTTAISTNGSTTATSRSDSNRSGNYTLAFTAAIGSNGQLAYTGYSYSTTDAVHLFTKWSSTSGSMFEKTTDSNRTATTTGSGSTGSTTGTVSWQEINHSIYPNPMPGGSPFENTSVSGYTNPISEAGALPMPPASTTNWSWRAKASNATDYTFHGVAVQNGSLVESATSRVTNAGKTIDVTSFNSTSKTSDSGHIVANEPGTELFHRDETFAYVDDVIGSGSYVGGSANANYYAVEVGTFAAANAYTVNNEFSSGIDSDGQAYSLNFNFSRSTNGSGSITNTHDYHDGSAGMELTGGSIGISGGSTVNSRSWGTRNGQAFDDPSLTIETVSNSTTYPASGGVVRIADGLEDAFPFRGMINPGNVFIQTWVLKGPQGVYDKFVGQIGKKAEPKAGIMIMKLSLQLELDSQANGGPPLATGTYNVVGKGDTHGVALGLSKKQDQDAAQYVKMKEKTIGCSNITLDSTDMEITYAIDQADQNPRSGNAVMHYRIVQNFSYTRGGVRKTQQNYSAVGDIKIHDEHLEKKVLLK